MIYGGTCIFGFFCLWQSSTVFGGSFVRSSSAQTNHKGETQLRHSASPRGYPKQRFCLRQHAPWRLYVCGFSANSVEKPHSIDKKRIALSKAEHVNCVSPITDTIGTSMLPFVLNTVEGQAEAVPNIERHW
jgi:hypothetical protein